MKRTIYKFLKDDNLSEIVYEYARDCISYFRKYERFRFLTLKFFKNPFNSVYKKKEQNRLINPYAIPWPLFDYPEEQFCEFVDLIEIERAKFENWSKFKLHLVQVFSGYKNLGFIDSPIINYLFDLYNKSSESGDGLKYFDYKASRVRKLLSEECLQLALKYPDSFKEVCEWTDPEIIQRWNLNELSFALTDKGADIQISREDIIDFYSLEYKHLLITSDEKFPDDRLLVKLKNIRYRRNIVRPPRENLNSLTLPEEFRDNRDLLVETFLSQYREVTAKIGCEILTFDDIELYNFLKQFKDGNLFI